MKEVYRGLSERWMGDSYGELGLKTDLYDEAISPHGLIPLCQQRCEVVIGADISLQVALVGRRNVQRKLQHWDSAVCADIRNSAFKSNSFDQVISNSTLDHFVNIKDITECLKELWRIAKPGGTLIITLDNPSNPIVRLRNSLPYRFLKLLGLVPYYMGVTLSKSELERVLESTGFEVFESTSIVHAPRILGIWAGRILQRLGNEKLKEYYFRFLEAFERLEKFFTRYLTGYFVAIKATKRAR